MYIDLVLPAQPAARCRRFVVDHMKGSDNVGITTYANHAETPLPLQAMTYVAKERARKVIAEIEAGGATAFYDGLEAGLQEMEGAAPGDVTADAVLLMTDGHPSHVRQAAPLTLAPWMQPAPESGCEKCSSLMSGLAEERLQTSDRLRVDGDGCTPLPRRAPRRCPT